MYDKIYQETEKSNRVGRPSDVQMADSFNLLREWLEESGDCEMYTLKEACEKMVELSKCERVFEPRTIKRKLKEHYKEHIYFTELSGTADVVCFREMAWCTIYERKKRKEETKEDIINAAAKIIKADLRELEKPNATYPTTDEINDMERNKQWVPESLQILLRFLVPSTLKQVSIGQCITQVSRPRTIICPIHFGLGVQLEKSFGSKWLVNHLHRFGFSISSGEVTRFKHSAIESAVANESV